LQPLFQKFVNWLNESRYPGAGVRPGIGPQPGRTIAVGSGKGGVGKTLVSSSIALALAQGFGHRVVAIDVDLGGANLHTGLGIKIPTFALNRFILEKVPLQELSTSTGFHGLEFVSGASDIIGLAEFTDDHRARFLNELISFREETVVLDLGAGSSLFNLDLFCNAREGILVTTTEPTAVQNAYGFLRAAIFRSARLLYQAEGTLLEMVENAANHRGSDEMTSIPNLIWRMSRVDRPAAERLEELVAQLRIGLVVNMAKAREAEWVADSLLNAVRRYLGTQLDFLGSVGFDASVRRSVCEWRPLLVHFPTARASRRLASVAAKVSGHLSC
jgi:flagellar biosynthesis protein FlhG